ncbi:MAG: ABC transporter permease [Arachnia sp.]
MSATRRTSLASRLGLWSAYPVRVQRAPWSWTPAAGLLLIVVVAWSAAACSGAVPAVALPDPVDVAARCVEWVANGVILRYVGPTLAAAVAGSALAALVGVPLGILIAHSRFFAAALEPWVAFSQTVPLVAVAPLLVIWLDYGTTSVAVLAAIIAFFPMVTTTVVGVRGLDRTLIEQAWLDGATGQQRLWHVELPVAAPAILAGLRAGVVLSMTGAIVGEFVMGGQGIGTLIAISREAADTVGVFALLVWIAILALALQGLIHAAEGLAARRLEGDS